MREKIILMCFLLYLPLNVIISKDPNSRNSATNDQALFAGPNPANNFLDVKIKPELITSDTEGLIYEVKVFNQKGAVVFSATKQAKEFSIFTGGLPDGTYKVACKIDTIQVTKEFSVRH